MRPVVSALITAHMKGLVEKEVVSRIGLALADGGGELSLRSMHAVKLRMIQLEEFLLYDCSALKGMSLLEEVLEGVKIDETSEGGI